MIFKLSDFIMMETQFPSARLQVILDFDTRHLSIIKDISDNSNYEVATYASKEGIANSVLEVKANLTEADVDDIINSIHQLTKVSPVQV